METAATTASLARGSAWAASPGRKSVFEQSGDTRQGKNTIKAMAIGMRERGIVVTASVFTALVLGVLSAICIGVLHGHGGTFTASARWANTFMKQELGWSVRAGTTAAQKLPVGWEVMGVDMRDRLAVLVGTYGIPPDLVVNFDQTGVYYVPTMGARTYAPRGSKDVSVLGMEDKRQFTAVMGSSAAGALLPMQIVYKGKVASSLPAVNARADAVAAGFHFTLSSNHWSSQLTMEQYLEEIISPYVNGVIEKLKLLPSQKAVVILDCWSVHKSVAFITYVHTKFPNIFLLFVPGGTTGKFQPADIALNRPFKHYIREKHTHWVADQFRAHVVAGGDPSAVVIDMSIKVVRNLSAMWLHHAWSQLAERGDVIKKGWEQSGLLGAWDPAVINAALLRHARGELFKNVVGEHVPSGGMEEPDESLVDESMDEGLPGDAICQRIVDGWYAAGGGSEAVDAGVSEVPDAAWWLQFGQAACDVNAEMEAIRDDLYVPHDLLNAQGVGVADANGGGGGNGGDIGSAGGNGGASGSGGGNGGASGSAGGNGYGASGGGSGEDGSGEGSGNDGGDYEGDACDAWEDDDVVLPSPALQYNKPFEGTYDQYEIDVEQIVAYEASLQFLHDLYATYAQIEGMSGAHKHGAAASVFLDMYEHFVRFDVAKVLDVIKQHVPDDYVELVALMDAEGQALSITEALNSIHVTAGLGPRWVPRFPQL